MSDYNEFGYTILNTGNVRFMKLFHSWRHLLNYVYELQELNNCLIFYSAQSSCEKEEHLEVKTQLHYFKLSMVRNKPSETSEDYAYTLYLGFLHDRIKIFISRIVDIDKKYMSFSRRVAQCELSVKLFKCQKRLYNSIIM